jgi:indole-3-glycerol phosphate synthase
MNFLATIIEKRRERVEAARQLTSLEQMRRLAEEVRSTAKPHALVEALRVEGINIVAEFKRRSPSKGMIRAEANVIEIAQCYDAGGAAGMSVLTEEDYFAGTLDDLRMVKASVNLPVPRKDFVFDDYQVYESAAAGADAILLIVAALDDDTIRSLRRLSEDELGMDALIEVHTADELKRATACGAKLIGVNNRDLRTFEVSLDTSLSLASQMPQDAVPISESGLHSPADLQRLREAGYRGFLIGETLMRADNPAEALRNLRADK